MKTKIFVGFVFVAAIVFTFYWYELRPAGLRSYCDWNVRWGSEKTDMRFADRYELLYRSCLRSKGIEMPVLQQNTKN